MVQIPLNEEVVEDTPVYKESDALAAFKGPLKSQGSMCYAIPTMRQAERCVEEKQGCDSLECKTLAFLHNSYVQIALAALLILDVTILFIELALLTLYPSCHIIERDAISCCPAQDSHSLRWLAGGSDDHDFCEEGVANEEYEAGCDEHKWHKVHTAEEWLFGITIAILSILLLENLVTVWALRPSVFFRQAFYVFDLFIVAISLALELTFHFLGEDNVASLVGLLVLGRIWRFVRICHGIVEVVTDLSFEKYERLMEYTELLEKRLVENGISIPEEAKRKATEHSPLRQLSHITTSK